MNRALFLDRDGVLNDLVYYESSGEWESPRNVADLTVTGDASEPLQRLVEAGWLLFVVTNQPSYAKGKTTMQELQEVQNAVIEDLGVPITHAYVCFHHPHSIVPELLIACDCRKPGTLFLRQAAREYEVDLAQSWMVGDQDTDLACGRNAGCKVALLENPHSANKRGAIEPDLRVATLEDLAEALLQL